jgi:hypothetical protein
MGRNLALGYTAGTQHRGRFRRLWDHLYLRPGVPVEWELLTPIYEVKEMVVEPTNSAEEKEAAIAEVLEHLRVTPDSPRERIVRKQYIESIFGDKLTRWGATAAEVCYREAGPIQD